jgi:hypothetical protein
MKFQLGQVVATPAAMELLGRLGINPATILLRHVSGDWGDLGNEDRAANDLALTPGAETRILSAYNVGPGERVWIITEADRSYTTILLPTDY